MKKKKINAKSYGTLNKEEIKKAKIRKIIFVIISVLFFGGGTACGIVGLYLSGWDFMEFIKSPGLLLGAVLALLAGVILLSTTLTTKGNSNYGE